MSCDACGGVAESVRGSALFWPLAEPLEVRDTGGCRRPVDGFVIVCLGVCDGYSTADDAPTRNDRETNGNAGGVGGGATNGSSVSTFGVPMREARPR